MHGKLASAQQKPFCGTGMAACRQKGVELRMVAPWFLTVLPKHGQGSRQALQKASVDRSIPAAISNGHSEGDRLKDSCIHEGHPAVLNGAACNVGDIG